MYHIVTCLENSAALIGIEILLREKKANYNVVPSSFTNKKQNTITFINKSNACCGLFIIRLSLHGIALMCLLAPENSVPVSLSLATVLRFASNDDYNTY